MRLAKIKLAGFKSFVDPTTFHLPSNLVGIVGPNGCGKSNIIDAVRWVMGESSAKNLRGEAMTDVIFSGSNARKPVGQASIELLFDNSLGKLGGEYAKYAEISIKRVVTRDAQSNYYLNGTRCRRKDITDVFLGTGLGPRSYSIIEQGMISRLIEAKPEDLRIFIEEAAGISKYKERRKETETRIHNTRENISRINDVRDELGARLESLQRQAKAAEKYKELKQEERLIKAQLQALRWKALQNDLGTRERAVAAQETALEAKMADMRRAEATMEEQRQTQIEANERFNAVQGQFYAVGAEIARLEQTIRHAKETRQQQEKELAETEQACQEAGDHQRQDQRRIDELSSSLELDEQRLEETEQRAASSSERLTECEESMHQWQQRWDTFNQRAAEQVRAAEVERARIQHLESNLLQLQQRRQRLEDEMSALSRGELSGDIASLNEQLSNISREVTEFEKQAEVAQGDWQRERQRIVELNTRIKEERAQLQKARERFASLQALQEEALGKNDAALQQWVSATGLDSQRRLAEHLKAQAGWEQAVETVLGFHLEAICTDQLGDAAGKLSQLSQGNVTLLDTGAKVSGAAARAFDVPALIDKVSAPWALTSLLHGVYAAKDLDQALSLREQLQAGESLITPDGIWLGPNWLRVQRQAHAEGGVLAREQWLQELRAEIETRTTTGELLEDELLTSEENLQAAQQRREQAQQQRNDKNRLAATMQAQMSAKVAQEEQRQQRHAKLQVEFNELRARMENDENEVRQARGRLNSAMVATESHDQEREELLQQRDTHRLQLEDVRKVARADRDAAHEIALRCQTVRTQLQGTRQNLARIEQQLAHFRRRRDELTRLLTGSDTPIIEMSQQLERQLAQRLEVEASLAEARRALETVEHAMRDVSQQRHQSEQQILSLRTELDQQRLAGQELRIRSETLREQILESGFEMETVLVNLPEAANDAAWQEEFDRIGRSIARLGAINLAAIDEYTEQSERKRYLDAQFEDLTQALTTLETAIAKIDRETKSRFQETFDKVNKGLQERFPRLFGGGSAYLELTGEDLLSTGITVMARPPGKRNSTIHLLSGGEKALTAVALVFSIFDLNPAPFCMLDEVDAPLDEANVGRYCNLVKEMSEHVQFIFITHNKATMEMANQLTGVTMQEPGVSRLVAVDVDEAVQLAVSA